jgi:hypothetical protein
MAGCFPALTMATQPFRPGFRISATDIAVLSAGGVCMVLAGQAEWWMGLVIGFAVGHFFLFCNVFRVARPLELWWAALFVGLSGGTITLGTPGWPGTIATTVCATILVIGMQMRKPSYHGVGWQRINPELRQWWEAQGSGADRSSR